MAYDIILGRDASDKKKFGMNGLIHLGKGYVKMGVHTSLSNNIWMDVVRSHVILEAGKRGSGKSYSLGVIAEELSNLPPENAQNISSLIFDTMGIFWTMKYQNEKEKELLDSWNLSPRDLPVKVFVPYGKVDEYIKNKIPVDATFSLKPSEISSEEWITLFNLSLTSLQGVLIERTINELKEKEEEYFITEIIRRIENDSRASKETKEIVSALFSAAETWGIFSKNGETDGQDLLTPGTTTVLDISVYSSSSAYNIRALVIGLLSQKIFRKRMDARKKEERQAVQQGNSYLSTQEERDPLVWIFIDEAHEFLPKIGKTPASDALIQLLREGRQPGISLVRATQQPGEIHRDVMSQSDIVIAHRVTSKPDIEALNEIMQTYMLSNIKQQMDDLPSLKGSAIILDDNSERIYPLRLRPRLTWHGGETPMSIQPNKEFE